MTAGALSAEATSTFADTAMLRLHYHEAGAGDPVVLLHGGGPGASAWSNFGPNLPVFAERYRALMPDQPGFGQSVSAESEAPPVEGNYFTFSARALASLLDHLGIDRVHLVGNSLGGGTAVRFALNYPERAGCSCSWGPAGSASTSSRLIPPRESAASLSSRLPRDRARKKWRLS